MTEYVLTAIDITGIQKYIFGSNDLKQIVGASGRIHWATHELVYEKLIELGSTNIAYSAHDSDVNYLESSIETNNLNSELIYTGGGNTLIIFKNMDIAIDFSRKITTEVLLNASGLNLVVSHTKFKWGNDKKNNLAEIRQIVRKKLNKKKMDRIHSSPLMGLGVTADCQYTGLPAVELRKKEDMTKVAKSCNGSIRISKEVSDKLECYNRAEACFKKMFPEVKTRGYDFIHDFNDFGTKHESSYMAVVHADGNNMGKRFQAIANNPHNKNNNREYIKSIREFSESIRIATTSAINDTVNQMMDKIDSTLARPEDTDLKNTFEKMIYSGDERGFSKKGKKILPFRPIIVGGDDLTFVCDGRLGLTLTELYLRKLRLYKLSDEKPMSAKAGIAIVKSHYPFSRAVSMAEELEGSAKEIIMELSKGFSEKDDFSAMDWHFGTAGSLDRLDAIRKRSFTVYHGSSKKTLYMRPVYVGANTGSNWHSWDNFSMAVSKFQNSEWLKRKNKLISLREVLPDGPIAVRHFMTLYKLKDNPGLPAIPGNKGSNETGWIGDECTCFDAIEALDFFIPLDGD